MKSYLKACLSLWSSPGVTADENDEEMEATRTADEDKVRLAAFLSMRKIAMSSDEGVLDLVLKVFFLVLSLNDIETHRLSRDVTPLSCGLASQQIPIHCPL
jgi:hypothetical protein